MPAYFQSWRTWLRMIRRRRKSSCGDWICRRPGVRGESAQTSLILQRTLRISEWMGIDPPGIEHANFYRLRRPVRDIARGRSRGAGVMGFAFRREYSDVVFVHIRSGDMGGSAFSGARADHAAFPAHAMRFSRSRDRKACGGILAQIRCEPAAQAGERADCGFGFPAPGGALDTEPGPVSGRGDNVLHISRSDEQWAASPASA